MVKVFKTTMVNLPFLLLMPFLSHFFHFSSYSFFSFNLHSIDKILKNFRIQFHSSEKSVFEMSNDLIYLSHTHSFSICAKCERENSWFIFKFFVTIKRISSQFYFCANKVIIIFPALSLSQTHTHTLMSVLCSRWLKKVR